MREEGGGGEKKKRRNIQREYANILQRRFTFNVLIAPKTSIFYYPGPTKRCSTNALLGFIIRSLVLKLMLKAGIQRERDIYIYIHNVCN